MVVLWWSARIQGNRIRSGNKTETSYPFEITPAELPDKIKLAHEFGLVQYCSTKALVKSLSSELSGMLQY
jgi:hypothetical protein